jgi:ABC-type Fe3+-hydroxamate transport system substrate-binding protein
MLMPEFPVWMSDISNLEEALEMIQRLGKILQKEKQASKIIEKINNEFEQLPKLKPRTCAYLIWKKPYMCAGSNTFINDMLQRCQLINVFSNQARYPEISLEDLLNKQADLILLSSEPYPFKNADVEQLQLLCPYSKVIQVDGELFSWYGTRLMNSPAYFEKILNTDW